jgi:hypothetical protein
MLTNRDFTLRIIQKWAVLSVNRVYLLCSHINFAFCETLKKVQCRPAMGLINCIDVHEVIVLNGATVRPGFCKFSYG